MKETIKILLTVGIALVIVVGAANALDYYRGTPEEINQLVFDGKIIDDKIDARLDELGFKFLPNPFGSKDGFGGTTNLDSLTLDSNLIVTGTTDLAADSINYNEINPDAFAYHWVDCDETATSSSDGLNPCSYTNETGNAMYVTEVGFVVASATTGDGAVIDVEWGTASDTLADDPNIFDDLEVGYGTAGTSGAGIYSSADIASSYASAFSPFVLADSSAIWATNTSGSIEESIMGMFIKWTEPPSIIDADTDS